jgi:hypothetical protein
MSHNLKCLVLDLDHTLVATAENDSQWKREYKSDTNMYYFVLDNELMWGRKRPYSKQFVRYCQNNFDMVGVWSAGTKEYVERIVENVWEELEKPAFIWSRKDCDHIIDIKSDNNLFLYKPLSKVFNKYSNLNYTNTLILDDTIEVSKFNPLNIIHINKFEIDEENPKESNDTELVKLVEALRDIPENDVREFIY